MYNSTVKSVSEGKRYTLDRYSTNIEDVSGLYMVNTAPIEYVKLMDDVLYLYNRDDCSEYNNIYIHREDIESRTSHAVARVVPCMNEEGIIIVDIEYLPVIPTVCFYRDTGEEYLEWIPSHEEGCITTTRANSLVPRYI